MTDQVLRRVGRCIYCYTTEGKLQKEHIVPYALNGTWVLEDASCASCSKVTSRFERIVLRRHLLKVRSAFGLKTRRPGKRPGKFPLEFVSPKGKEIIDISVRDQPVFLSLPLYRLPGCALGEENDKSRWFSGFDFIRVAGPSVADFHHELRRKGKDSALFRVRFSPGAFAKMIGKIAYGFAVAHFGLENIDEAWVLPAILGKTKDIDQWVGCDIEEKPVKEEAMHAIRIKTRKDRSIVGMVVLFSQIKTQPYAVAVGRASAGSQLGPT